MLVESIGVIGINLLLLSQVELAVIMLEFFRAGKKRADLKRVEGASVEIPATTEANPSMLKPVAREGLPRPLLVERRNTKNHRKLPGSQQNTKGISREFSLVVG